jgi:hypothetical protein
VQFTLLGIIFNVKLSDRKTIWFTNVHSYSCREDHLLALKRVYHRDGGLYTWQITIGRLLIQWARLNQPTKNVRT